MIYHHLANLKVILMVTGRLQPAGIWFILLETLPFVIDNGKQPLLIVMKKLQVLSITHASYRVESVMKVELRIALSLLEWNHRIRLQMSNFYTFYFRSCCPKHLCII